MQATPAIVRFRGIVTPPIQESRLGGLYRPAPTALRAAVIEFPPERRTLLVEAPGSGRPFLPYRCQIPYMIFVIFYHRKGRTIRLDRNLWPDSGAPGFRRVCHFFREAPLTALRDPVHRSPFVNQYGAGKTCFGYAEAAVARLFGPHTSLHGLVQTVTEFFWGSYHNGLGIAAVPARGGFPGFNSIDEWAKRSRKSGFLGKMDWTTNGTFLIPEIIPEGVWVGRFNPGHRVRTLVP